MLAHACIHPPRRGAAELPLGRANYSGLTFVPRHFAYRHGKYHREPPGFSRGTKSKPAVP